MHPYTVQTQMYLCVFLCTYIHIWKKVTFFHCCGYTGFLFACMIHATIIRPYIVEQALWVTPESRWLYCGRQYISILYICISVDLLVYMYTYKHKRFAYLWAFNSQIRRRDRSWTFARIRRLYIFWYTMIFVHPDLLKYVLQKVTKNSFTDGMMEL